MTEQHIAATNALSAGTRAAIIAKARAEFASDASARQITTEDAFVNDGLRQAGLPRLRPGEFDAVVASATASAATPTTYRAQSGVPGLDDARKESAALSEVKTMLVTILAELGFDPSEYMKPEMLPKVLNKIRGLRSRAASASSIPTAARRAYGGKVFGHAGIYPGD